VSKQSSRYNEQWPQSLIDRLIPDLSYRVHLVTTVVHARDYIREQRAGLDSINALEILGDGLKNLLESSSTGLEWWTIRHRLSDREIQAGEWLDQIKTSWITARQAEEIRNGRQR